MTINAVDVSVWYDAFSTGKYKVTSAYQERTIDPDNFYSLVIKSGRRVNVTGSIITPTLSLHFEDIGFTG